LVETHVPPDASFGVLQGHPPQNHPDEQRVSFNLGPFVGGGILCVSALSFCHTETALLDLERGWGRRAHPGHVVARAGIEIFPLGEARRSHLLRACP